VVQASALSEAMYHIDNAIDNAIELSCRLELLSTHEATSEKAALSEQCQQVVQAALEAKYHLTVPRIELPT
jgi:hypothetical protein